MEQSVIVGIITFCLGVIFGHRLTLWRDRRKEFNDIAQQVRIALLNEKGNLSPIRGGIGEIEADMLESVLPFFKKRRFRHYWNEYKEAKKQATLRDSVGGCYFGSTDEIIVHIEKLLSFTERQ
jgi:hypothetical protein